MLIAKHAIANVPNGSGGPLNRYGSGVKTPKGNLLTKAEKVISQEKKIALDDLIKALQKRIKLKK